MGQDKALMPFLGQRLIERVLSRVDHLADETIITTNHPAGYRYLNLRLVPDPIPGRSALGGLYTALEAARHPFVAVVACDLPFVNADILAAAYSILKRQTGTDAVIPRTEQGLEPLHAVYRRETCLPAVKDAIEADQWRLVSWHPAANIHLLPPEELRSYEPNGVAFRNVNTPEAFRRAEKIAQNLDRSASQ